MQTRQRPPLLLPLGDEGLSVVFGEGLDLDINQRACAFAARMRALDWPFITDIVPAFGSVGLHYRAAAVPLLPGLTPLRRMEQLIADLLDASSEGVSEPARSVEIPVCYGGEHGPDLEDVARHGGLSTRELIAQHTAVSAHVFMLGFAPGLPYLGLWGEAFALPRRDTPRTRVPAGSVAVANRQSVIYPFDLPGGWHLIGRTPLTIFAPGDEQPALLSPGDEVRFVAITAREFEKMASGLRS